MKKLASVIIPVKDDSRIRRCVESVLNQEFKMEECEVIVVDNGSRRVDISRLLADLPVIILLEEYPGISKAANRGLKAASGEFIVRIDADCVANPNWLNELLAPFGQDKRIGVVGGAVFKEAGKNLVESAARGLVIGDQLVPQYLPMFDAPYVVTANAAYRSHLIKEIGGFDEEMISGSDVDISWRIFIEGYKIQTARNAIVHHPSRSTIKKYFVQFFRYGVGHAHLFKKYQKITRKKFLVNVYPIQGIFHLFIHEIPDVMRLIIKRKNKRKVALMKLMLDFIEYLALICGDVVGAFYYRVLYF